ncbi:MAG TPA: hypothetical protein VIJ43_03205 [Burkholderiales bacterium]
MNADTRSTGDAPFYTRIERRRMPPMDLRAARANHVFGTDEKRIRTKNMVMDKNNYGLGLP